MKLLTPEIEFCRATVKSWEKLRLLYNVILLLPGIALIWRIIHLQQVAMVGRPPGMGFPIMHSAELVIRAFVFGLCANLCFCLGLYTEVVITALGFPLSARRIRYVIFGVGLILSLAVMSMPWLLMELDFLGP